MIHWWSTELGEEEAEAAARAIRDRHLSMGELTSRFEEEFAAKVGAQYALATTSGTTAMVLAYWALGLEPGDEVLVPAGTFIATANAAAVRGVGIKLVDISAGSFTFDAESIEASVTPATRAVAVVHLNGRAADMARVLEVARRHDLLVVEDAAQALVAEYDGRMLGTIGDVGCYSLGVTKLVTTGQGGMLVTNRREVYERAHDLRDNFRLSHGGRDLALNFKFPDILAAVGRVQLTKLGEHRASALAQYARYRERLAPLRGVEMFEFPLGRGTPLWNEIWVDRREELVAFLAERGIEVSLVHPPLHVSSVYATDAAFPHTDWHSRRALYLPSGPAQSDVDLDRVAEAVTDFARLTPSERP